MIKKEKIFFTVKAYPTLSGKYGELVCTAGVREDGSWVRIYPMPFRRFEDYKRFKKYTWVEMQLQNNTSDPRPESFKPLGWDFEILDSVDCKNNWARRKELVLKNNIYDNMSVLIDKANKNELSLATFKPAKVIDFIWKDVDREWDSKKLENTLMDLKQTLLFDVEGFKKEFRIISKLPYRFKYKFEDITGKCSEMMIEDWETGQLFWNCLNKYGSEQAALEKVKQKYFDEFVSKKDLYFFLGTTKQFHGWAKNPFLIVGTFHPPKEKKEVQMSLEFPDFP